jgi:hypothetical protein
LLASFFCHFSVQRSALLGIKYLLDKYIINLENNNLEKRKKTAGSSSDIGKAQMGKCRQQLYSSPKTAHSRARIFNVYGAPELIPRNEFRQPM